MVKRVDDATGTPQTSGWVYDTAPGAGIGKLHSECRIPGAADPEDCLDPGVDPQSKKTYAYTDRGQVEDTEYFIDTHGWEQSFVSSQSYDAFGRVQLIRYPEVGGERLTVENRYSPFGGLWYVLDVGDPMDSGDDSVYWIADMVDVRGKVIQETLRNQNIISNSTNTATGWLQKVESWDKDLNMIQQTRYAFDSAGNVLSRERFRPWLVNPDGSFQAGENEQVSESFTYDSLDRLLSATVSRNGVLESIKSNDYDRLGNFLYKDDPDNTYAYTGCNAGPHAVCAANGTTFTYDANGNMVVSTGAKARTVEYSAFNKPARITEGGATVEFVYGADRARVFKQAVKADGGIELTWYVGLGAEGAPLYEQTAVVGSGLIKREHLHFIYAGGHHGGQAFAVHVQQAEDYTNPAQPDLILGGHTEYYHRDHLGSVIAMTYDQGVVQETKLLSFDAWGKRRKADWREGPPDQYTPTGMRGNLAYTGHEAVPEVGLIHMNGRVYDPELGVFLSADPHIQAGSLSQNYHRYSYVLNNPIKYNDPSGYFITFVVSMLVAASELSVLEAMVIMFTVSYMESGGNLRAAMITALSAGVTHGIGSAFGAMGEFTGKLLVKSVVHGLAQGIFTEAAGGKFSEGFAGGFAGSMIGNPAGKIDNLVLSTLVAAMVGGTVSELSGGKFRNGAKSAAMVHLFNQCAHVGCGSDESEEADSWPPKDYEKLTVDERREAWNRFVKEYDQISKGWNDPNFPGLPRLGDGWGKNLRRIVGKGVVEVFEFHDWGSEKSVYNLGTRSLEAFRAHPPIGNMKRDFMDWSTVRWENYDFGGPIKQTVDFHYWVNGRSDLRPADCYLTGGC